MPELHKNRMSNPGLHTQGKDRCSESHSMDHGAMLFLCCCLGLLLHSWLPQKVSRSSLFSPKHNWHLTYTTALSKARTNHHHETHLQSCALLASLQTVPGLVQGNRHAFSYEMQNCPNVVMHCRWNSKQKWSITDVIREIEDERFALLIQQVGCSLAPLIGNQF